MLSRSLGTQRHRDLLNWISFAALQTQQHSACAPQTIAASDRLICSPQSSHGVCGDILGPRLLARTYRTSLSNYEQQQTRLVTAFLKDILSSLSIPHAELDQLAASNLTDAAITAWALTKTATHPAVQEAAAASQRLQQLLIKLDGAMLWQHQAASSPLGHLLWQVAVGARGSEVASQGIEQLEGSVEHQVLQALARDDNMQRASPSIEQLVQEIHRMTDMPALAALNHPEFWHLAKHAALAGEALSQDLSLLGYDLLAAATAAAAQTQQLQQWTGTDIADLQQQLKQKQFGSSLLQPGKLKQLLAAVAGDAAARKAVSQLTLLQVLAQALGLSAVQISSTASPCELVARLTGRRPAQRQLSQQLSEQLIAAAPALLDAVSQLPAAALEHASIGSLLQLMRSKAELQELAASLTSWRAEAAAAGYLPVLTTLTQTEVAALSKPQAEALGRAMMQLEAQGQLLLRKAAAKALQLNQLDASDAAALAWKVHAGGDAAADSLVKMLLEQACSVYESAVSELESAESAVKSMAAGFQLEEVTSRRSTAAPPSAVLMAGIPQHQVSELSKFLTPFSPSQRLNNSSTTESLVRHLAYMLNPADRDTTSQAAAAQRLHVVAHDLPKVLSGPLLELLTAYQQRDSISDAAGARIQQERLRAFVRALEAELPRLAAAAPAEDSSTGSGSNTSAWAAAGVVADVPAAAAEGLVELLGEQETAELLADAAKATAAEQSRRGADDEEEDDGSGLYEMLADVHHDGDVQRYLQMEFDPALELDVVHAPEGWQGADLFVSPEQFLDSMKPLLDRYLVAQGQHPVQDLEWQVYRDAALVEHEQTELATSSARRVSGHSPFHNSRADEAYLKQRLEKAIPKDSVLYAAAQKYLQTSFKNRSWTFAQRKRLVDRLAEIAGHLQTHPPRMHRGSPFSALFQAGGPPAVPRLSRDKIKPGMAASVSDTESYALPAGFGARM